VNSNNLWRAIAILITITLFFFLAPTPGFSATPQERIDGAIRLIKKMAEQEDSPRMADLVKDAKGIAIFPSVIKAGLIIGGQRGEGLSLKKEPSKNKWYGPNFVNITGLSYGLQIGAQSIGLVLVVINEDGLRGFMGDNVKLSGDLSVAAGPLGRHTEAGTDSRLEASIYSYSIAKGLFAGLSVEGAVIDVDENANIAYWGADMSPKNILSRPATDVRIKPLLREISNLEKKAKSN